MKCVKCILDLHGNFHLRKALWGSDSISSQSAPVKDPLGGFLRVPSLEYLTLLPTLQSPLMLSS